MPAFGFARPLLLWGLLGVLIPVVIHLLGRRRVRTVPFATLRFLERARARAAARWRLRRLLLLAARAAALACLALLFAGPGCDEPGRSEGPATWVLLLDTSPSMAASRGAGSCLDRARAELLAVLDRADPRDRFLFASTREGAEEGWRRGFTADAGAVRRTLARAEVEHGAHRVGRALERAFRLLEGVDGGRVVLATDLQASAWGDERVAGVGRTPLRIADVGFRDPANTWVAGADETGGAVRVRLGSSGGPAGEVRRTLRLRLEDGQTLTAFTQGPEASFRTRVPPGLHSGEVSLAPGGDLGLDDRAWFVSKGTSKVRVLLVNGDPRGFEIRDELFFVRRALAPGGKLGDGFEWREVRAADLAAADLEGVDVAVLANPGNLSAAAVGAMQSRLERGLGLLVAAGDRWRPRESPGPVGALLAVPLRDAVAVASPDSSRRSHEPLDPLSLSGPLAPFLNREAGDLAQTRTWTYWVPESRGAQGGPAGTEVLMRLENGAPLLLDRAVGRGRTLLLATTLDRDGSDLCLQPGFVPWLERLFLHAASRLKPVLGRAVAAGEPVALPYGNPVAVEGPGGFKADWAPGDPLFVPPVPGVYRVKEGDAAVDGFAAGVAPRESDLTRLDEAGLDARLGKGGYSLGSDTQPALAGTVGRRDVSGRYAAGLLLALAGEALLAARWAGRRTAKLELDEGQP